MIGQTVSHYRIVEKIGEGGMAKVYLAEDLKLGRRIALKLLPAELAASEERLSRFQREARVLASLDHPNIVQIFSVERAGDVHFLTMQLVDGVRLSEHITEDGMPLDRFFKLAIPLADALSAAHEKGVTHRDLKPSNVMVDVQDRVRVLDFGLAKLRRQQPGIDPTKVTTDTFTRAGTILGTLPYMSPEQLQGRGVDHRTDIFALGVIYYEMLAGRRPFRGESAAALVSTLLRDPPTDLPEVRPGVPPELSALVRRCLEKRPGRRYESTAALRTDLEALAEPNGAVHTARSIAVLPFVDMTPAGDQGYFCDGIAEDILNWLTQVSELRVAARTSSFLFRDGATDVREIGRALNVSTILEGSVRKSGSRVRITAQLINVADGYHLWSDRYDRELTDIFEIQDEISESIVRALEVTLSPKEQRCFEARPKASIEAYEHYLRGQQCLNRSTREDTELALQLFRRAAEIDPEYGLAYAGVSECHATLYHWYGRRDVDLEEAERASREAIRLAPKLAEAHTSHGFVLTLRGRFDDASAAFERAIDLNPKLFEAYYYFARDRMTAADWPRAAELFELAAEVRPEDYQALLLAPQIYRSLGREDKALDASRRGIARARRRLALHPEDVRAHSLGAGGLLALGERQEALEWIEKAIELQPNNPIHLYNAACVFARADDSDRAIELLSRAVSFGFGVREWFENDSDLEKVRSDPRFQRLLEETDWSAREAP